MANIDTLWSKMYKGQAIQGHRDRDTDQEVITVHWVDIPGRPVKTTSLRYAKRVIDRELSKPRVGDRVITLCDAEPYYSGYGTNQKHIIPAGSEGVIGAVDVPPVRYPRGWLAKHPRKEPPGFYCVDFQVPGVYQGDPEHGNITWRCALYLGQFRIIRDEESN